MKLFFRKAAVVFAIIIVVVFIGFRQGKLFNYSFSEPVMQDKGKPTIITLEEARYLFPAASTITEDAIKQIVVKDEKGKIIGYIVSSKPYSNSLTGFAGPVHFVMGIDTKNTLVGIKLTEHNESPGYLDFITKEGFFDKLKNKPIESIVNDNIDAVSGASMTTNCIIKALKQKAAEYNKTSVKIQKTQIKKKITDGLTLLVIAFSLLCYFTKYFKRFRLVLLSGSVILLGFVNGTFISMFLMYGWIQTGIPLFTQTILSVIFILAVVLPLFINRSFYCDYLCPYGAAQELAGKILKKKQNIPFRERFLMKHLREIIFLIVVLLLLLNVTFDLTNIEPFSAFIFVSASLTAIILAVLFLILSVFYNKPWCHYFCPTGQFLSFFKQKSTPKKATVKVAGAEAACYREVKNL
ncbi:MAG: quinol dehydrogenase membrane component [Bacteroidetes bacterium ADurb.Bin408]|nr:MAG: quinol dehydrogenase membrane component [Bacteroidetes bacterium ADurb.Bin408]